jgi:hypothetical protein
MMIKRCLSFIGFALATCLGSLSSYASERVGFGESIYRVVAYVQPYGGEHTKHELTLAQWRSGSDTGSSHIKSNLIALSNHFGLIGAVPMAVPDWPAAINLSA